MMFCEHVLKVYYYEIMKPSEYYAKWKLLYGMQLVLIIIVCTKGRQRLSR